MKHDDLNKKLSENPKKNSHQAYAGLVQDDDPIIWPSLKGYLLALKRQSLIAALVSLPMAAVVIFGLLQWESEYSSTSGLVFNPKEISVDQQQESSLTLASRVASTFSARFADSGFQADIWMRLEAAGIDAPVLDEPKLKAWFGGIVPERFQPGSWRMSPEDRLNKLKSEILNQSLVLETLPSQLQLNVTAKSSNPSHAQIIAREAVLAYVEEDLQRHRLSLIEQLRKLNALESSILREKSNPQDLLMTPSFQESQADQKSPVSDAEKKSLKSREQKMVPQIISMQRELIRAQSSQYEKEFALQNELNALLSKRGAEHPEVIQKQIEIQKFKSRGSILPIEREIMYLKNELNMLQVEMRGKGIPIDRSVQTSGFPDEVRRYLLDVSNQIKSLELEINNTDAQLQDKNKWVRYRWVRDAEFPTKPSDQSKLFAAAFVGIALVVLTFLLTIIIREMNSPWLADPEIIANRYRLPILINLPRRYSRHLPFLKAETIRALRARLGELRQKKVRDLVTFDSYRYLQQTLKSQGNPQVICLFDLGLDRTPASTAANLANVIATDNSERVILLSFHPEAQLFLPKAEAADLMEFLAGNREWKDCRIKASEQLSCDTALASKPELSLGHFREDLVQRLIKALRDKYQCIIIDGLNPMFVNENAMLGREADAIIIRMNLGKTRKADLERLLQVTDNEKIQGVICT